jgi:hypothetical protein
MLPTSWSTALAARSAKPLLLKSPGRQREPEQVDALHGPTNLGEQLATGAGDPGGRAGQHLDHTGGDVAGDALFGDADRQVIGTVVVEASLQTLGWRGLGHGRAGSEPRDGWPEATGQDEDDDAGDPTHLYHPLSSAPPGRRPDKPSIRGWFL